jgi:hypothetical protein
MILVNFASRSRPLKFFDCLDNIREHFTTPYRVLAKLDHDDPMGTDIYDLSEYPEVDVVWGYSSSKIHAINRDIPESGWDVLLNHSDDMWFTSHGADKAILDNAENDMVLHFIDQSAPYLMTYSIMDKAYYDRDKYIYHPDYVSMWCDNEATEVAKMRGRYKFIDTPIFEHRHPVWNKTEYDLQYQMQGGYYRIDEQTFLRRKAQNFK